MKYGVEGRHASGTVPECGAIFVANRETMKECLQRSLFGLPSGMNNFVKQVKSGMILFLFEHERKELFGVFKAISDGDINIIPEAYESSGMSFPAQVRIASLWSCSPLSEHEFRDVIQKNYYSAKKFNNGLSENQVRKLLCLFSEKKLDDKVRRRRIGREINLPFVEERGQIGDRRTDLVERESNLRNYPAHRFSTKLPEDSLENVKRKRYERYSMSDSTERDDMVDYEREKFWGKRRTSDRDVRELGHIKHQKFPNEMDDASIPHERSFSGNEYDNSYGRYRNMDDTEDSYSTKIERTEYSSPLTSLKNMQMPDLDIPYSDVSRTGHYDSDAPDIHANPLSLSPSYIPLNCRSSPKIESVPHHLPGFPSLTSCMGHGNVRHLPGILPRIQKISRVSSPFVDPSFAFESCYQDSSRKTVGPVNDEALKRKDSYSPGPGTLHSDDKNRESVFSRLRIVPEPRIPEQEKRTQMVHDPYGMDSSVDDIMHMLRQSQKSRQIAAGKYKAPTVRRQDNDEEIRANEFFAIHDKVSYERSRINTENDNPGVKFDVDQIIKTSDKSLHKDSRLVDFKRRSAVKRTLDENTPKDSIDIKESEGQLTETPSKRRKLVRPKLEQSTDKVTSASQNDTSPNADMVEEDNSKETPPDTNILNKLSSLLSKVKSGGDEVESSNEEPSTNLTSEEKPADEVNN